MPDLVGRDATCLAEFASAGEMRHALAALREKGYGALETYAPFDVPDPEHEVPRSVLPFVALGAGLLGAVVGYAVQWYTNVRSYPLDIGGRPAHAAPAFLLPAFEGGVLAAAVAVFVALLVVLRLPRLWRPVFEVDGFDRASVDRYWIAVGLDDRRADPALTVRELEALHPLRIVRVEAET
jgi:hypothetical protein